MHKTSKGPLKVRGKNGDQHSTFPVRLPDLSRWKIIPTTITRNEQRNLQELIEIRLRTILPNTPFFSAHQNQRWSDVNRLRSGEKYRPYIVVSWTDSRQSLDKNLGYKVVENWVRGPGVVLQRLLCPDVLDAMVTEGLRQTILGKLSGAGMV